MLNMSAISERQNVADSNCSAEKCEKYARNQNYKWIECGMRVFSLRMRLLTQHARASDSIACIYTMSLSCLSRHTHSM